MKYELPPKIKIYEALGSLWDNRIELVSDKESKCYSSSRWKFYTINFDWENKIYANDNWTYWKNYLWYPSIAHLLMIWKLDYDKKYEEALKDIKWKDINQDFKNDFDKTAEYIHWLLIERWYDLEEFLQEVDRVFAQIVSLDLELLLPKVKPPEGY
ncbi:MAG: hypothetical protein ACD_3C00086G0050 [uncultured bacterium (gcode 4)]|uniref:Uncharacterized protein n=1 Tax=uncultured bacterium (gcode 4) TaxID=1234023 RepID=K2FAR6_9BACT|nr:MAG: hypothetical protein ACD_3C00086G0050 [uncultured bacterium (gcode 4)]